MSDKISIVAAARFLGVSDRTVRSYIRAGFLSTTRGVRNTKWLDPLELEAFRQAQAEGKKVIEKKDFLEMRARLTRVEHELAVLTRILDTREQPLRMSPAYAKELHAACGMQLASGKAGLAEIEAWAEIFLRMDEQDLEVISRVSEDLKPWVLYLRLNVAMTALLLNDPEYATSLAVQGLHKKLAEGRRRLRVSGLCHLEMNGSTDRDVRRHLLSDSPASVLDALERVLKRKKASKP